MPHYAERLADAGYTALTFDPRGFGDSSSEPRARYDPNAVIEDYHSAVSHLLTRPEVDPGRVAAVGVCMGGGNAVSLGARDKRLRAVVSVAGGYDIGSTFQQGFGVEGFAKYVRAINDVVQQQYATARSRTSRPSLTHSTRRRRSRPCPTTRPTGTTTARVGMMRRTGLRSSPPTRCRGTSLQRGGGRAAGCAHAATHRARHQRRGALATVRPGRL